MGTLGPMEIVVIAGVGLLLFGGKRLADLGSGLGQGIKAFKQGVREADEPSSRAGADTSSARDASAS
jgi:sec-independent protein translocase protein TatA